MIQAVFTTMPMFVCLFWTVELLVRYKRSDRAKRVLGAFMLVAAVLYFAHGVYFNRDYALVPFTDVAYSFANVAVYPLYFLYILSLTSTKALSMKDYAILLPAIALGVVIGACYLVMSKTETAEFVSGYLYKDNALNMNTITKIQSLLHDTVKLVFAVQLIPIFYFGLRKIAAYNKLVMSYYSYTDNKSLYQIKELLLYFFVIAVISFIINIIGRVWFVDSFYMLIFPSVLFSVLLFAIGHIGTKIEFTVEELSRVQEACSDISEMNTENLDNLKSKIIEVMERDKLYLKPNLKISDLTQLMSTNRNYIYNAINVGMAISFSEFVNRYRVNHVKQLMSDSPELDINSVWIKSGFSSETSFYRNFKLYAGCSPQQWKGVIQASHIKNPS